MAAVLGVKISLEGSDNTGGAFKSAASNAKAMQGHINQVKQGWQSTFTAVSTTLIAVKEVFAPIVGMLGEPIKMAIESEKALNRLIKTMKATGNYSKEAADDIDLFINEMELISLTADEVISSVMAQNLAFGLNIRQSKMMIEASSALAKISGKELPEANMLLVQSLNSQVRGVQKYVKEISGLNTEEKRRGEVITMVINKLGYLNTAIAMNPSTVIARSNILWEQFQKEVGKTILSGVDWEKVYNRVEKLMEKFSISLDDNKTSLQDFGKLLSESMINGLETLLALMPALISGLSNLIIFFEKIGNIITIAISSISQLVLTFQLLWAAITGDNEGYNNIYRTMTNIHKALKGATLSLMGFRMETEKTQKVTKKGLEINAGGKSPDGKDIKSGTEAIKGALDERDKTVKKASQYTFKDMAKEQQAATKASIEDAQKWKNFFKTLFVGRSDNVAENEAANRPKSKDESGIFSKNPITVDNKAGAADAAKKRAEILEKINALETDLASKREIDMIKANNEIAKIEREANELGALGNVQRKKIADARVKIENDYSNSMFEVERSKSELIGDDKSVLMADQSRRRDELVNLQKETGADVVKIIKENKAQMQQIDEYYSGLELSLATESARALIDITQKRENDLANVRNTSSKEILDNEARDAELLKNIRRDMEVANLKRISAVKYKEPDNVVKYQKEYNQLSEIEKRLSERIKSEIEMREKTEHNAIEKINKEYESSKNSILKIKGVEGLKIKKMQEESVKATLKIQREENASKLDMIESNLAEAAKLEKKFDKEELERIRQQQDEISDITGMTYAKEQRDYEAHIKRLDELRAQGAFGVTVESGSTEDDLAAAVKSRANYEQAISDLNAKRAREKSGTSEDIYNSTRDLKAGVKGLFNEKGRVQPPKLSKDEVERLDKSWEKASNVFSTIKDGVQSMVESIGNMFGPVGQFFAGIINTFIMSSAQFRQMIDTFLQALVDFVPQMMDNIPIFLERVALYVPDIIASVLGTLLSVPRWVQFFSKVIASVIDSFKAIWSQLAFGESYKNKVDKAAEMAAAAQRKYTKFGSDKADQGENKFKIKDVSAKKASGLNEELAKLDSASEKAGKNVFQNFAQGWNDMVDLVTSIPGILQLDVWGPMNEEITSWPITKTLGKAGGDFSAAMKQAGQDLNAEFNRFINGGGAKLLGQISDPRRWDEVGASMQENIWGPANKEISSWDITKVLGKAGGDISAAWQSLSMDGLETTMNTLGAQMQLGGLSVSGFKTTMGDLEDMLDPFNVSLDDLGASFGGLSPQMSLSNLSMGGLKTTLEDLGKLLDPTSLSMGGLETSLNDLASQLGLSDISMSGIKTTISDLGKSLDVTALSMDGAKKSWDEFMEKLNISGTKKEISIKAATALDSAGKNLSSFVKSKFEDLKTIASKFNIFKDFKFSDLSGIATKFIDFVKNPFQTLSDIGDKLIGFVTSFTTAFETIGTKIVEILNMILGPVITAIQGLIDTFTPQFNTWIADFKTAISEAGTALWDSIKAGMDSAWESIKEKFADLGKTIVTGFMDVFRSAKDKVFPKKKASEQELAGMTEQQKKKYGVEQEQDPMQAMSDMGLNMWDGFLKAVTAGIETVKGWGSKIWSGLKAAVVDAVDTVKGWGGKIWSGLKAAVTDAPDTMAGWGSDIWSGLVTAAEGAYEWIVNVGTWIWEGLKGGLSDLAGGASGISLNKILGRSQGGDIPAMKGGNMVPIFAAMGALRAADGINSIPGVGISDTVPVLARAGERVLTPQQARAMDAGGINLTINISMAAGATAPNKQDIKDMGEKIIEYLKRESKNGRNILRPQGVY